MRREEEEGRRGSMSAGSKALPPPRLSSLRASPTPVTASCLAGHALAASGTLSRSSARPACARPAADNSLQSRPSGDGRMRSRRDALRAAVPPSVARDGSTLLSFRQATPLVLDVGQDAASPAERRPWRKQLYEKQPYPDNHVDDSLHSVLELASVSFSSSPRLAARCSPPSAPQ